MFLRTVFGILIFTIAICFAEQLSNRREICNVACPLEKPCPNNCESCIWPQGTKCCPQIGEPVCIEPRPPICSKIHCPERSPCPEGCKKCKWPVATGCCPYLGKPVCVDSEKMPPAMSLGRRGQDSDDARNSIEQANWDNMKASLFRRAAATSIFCPEYVIPCPRECPDTCIRPAGVSCPHQHPGWCPGWCSGNNTRTDSAGSVELN